jgi:hypothetical protein
MWVNEFLIKDKQICKNCGDVKIFHSINLCYNYEGKFKEVKKEQLSWLNYFKSLVTIIKEPVYSNYEPVYYKYDIPGQQKKFDEQPTKIIDLNLPKNPLFINDYDSPTLTKVNWLTNGIWVYMATYVHKNIIVFLNQLTFNKIKVNPSPLRELTKDQLKKSFKHVSSPLVTILKKNNEQFNN